MEESINAIGLKLAQLRKEKGMSTQEMEEYLGFNYKVVDTIESGNRSIDLKTLYKWVDACDMEVEITTIEKA